MSSCYPPSFLYTPHTLNQERSNTISARESDYAHINSATPLIFAYRLYIHLQPNSKNRSRYKYYYGITHSNIHGVCVHFADSVITDKKKQGATEVVKSKEFDERYLLFHHQLILRTFPGTYDRSNTGSCKNMCRHRSFCASGWPEILYREREGGEGGREREGGEGGREGREGGNQQQYGHT